MKKILSNFADSLISRDQMKKVKGGHGNSCIPALYYTAGSNGVIYTEYAPKSSFDQAYAGTILTSKGQSGITFYTLYTSGTC